VLRCMSPLLAHQADLRERQSNVRFRGKTDMSQQLPDNRFDCTSPWEPCGTFAT
jgi:hypothetical protein